jgi:ABC-type antimicrobial peptide transport system permease subunit
LPLHLMGRLRPGLDLTRAQADLDAIGRQLRQAAGQRDTGPAVTVYPGTTLHPDISRPVAAFTSVLMIVVSLVLLIVCVNVANLVLARAAGRSVELAIRQSVGAGRGRLIRTLLVRAAGAPGSALPAIIDAVRTQDAGVAVFNVATLSDVTALSLLPARIAGSLLGALGMLALLLAALGIYGVLSFIVRSRTQEIGVRIAIGATPREVAGLVARQAMTWTVWGIAIGLGLAVALTRFLEGFLHRISPTDPLTFATVALLLTAVAGVAAFVPARRASRLDPLVALRTW